MRVGDQSTREQMGPLVCMSLEEMERSVYTTREVVLTTHQDCGDVIYLIPVDSCRASTSTSAIQDHTVSYNTMLPFTTPNCRTVGLAVYELHSTH